MKVWSEKLGQTRVSKPEASTSGWHLMAVWESGGQTVRQSSQTGKRDREDNRLCVVGRQNPILTAITLPSMAIDGASQRDLMLIPPDHQMQHMANTIANRSSTQTMHDGRRLKL